MSITGHTANKICMNTHSLLTQPLRQIPLGRNFSYTLSPGGMRFSTALLIVRNLN
jgi:hypothetical protein